MQVLEKMYWLHIYLNADANMGIVQTPLEQDGQNEFMDKIEEFKGLFIQTPLRLRLTNRRKNTTTKPGVWRP